MLRINLYDISYSLQILDNILQRCNNMMLKSDLFLKLVKIYFISTCILGVCGRYSQSEIDEAFKKMVKREEYYPATNPLQEQFGCWPKNSIPYTIDPAFSHDQVQHIQRHIYQIQNRSCVRWVEIRQTSDSLKRYVKFQLSIDFRRNKAACGTREFKEYSPSNKTIVVTQILLREICFRKEVVIHEMLHALGLEHEHQRIDRDCYVDVNQERAKTDSDFKIIYDYKAFEKWPYDKRSILHYTRMSGYIRDKDESSPNWVWRYTLGDVNFSGALTGMDVYKLNYRFCKAPDYCKINNDECVKIEEEENRNGCKKIYMDIARGVVKPSRQ